MIDHLLIAPDQATLAAAIGAIVPVGPNPQPLWNAGNAETPAGWRADISFPCQITDNADPANPVVLTDYHLWVALPAKDPALSALPNCVLVADRDAANAGNPNFILQTTFTPAQLSNYSVSPVVAGSNYPFGNI